jgi:hypothetical protein
VLHALTCSLPAPFLLSLGSRATTTLLGLEPATCIGIESGLTTTFSCVQGYTQASATTISRTGLCPLPNGLRALYGPCLATARLLLAKAMALRAPAMTAAGP